MISSFHERGKLAKEWGKKETLKIRRDPPGSVEGGRI